MPDPTIHDATLYSAKAAQPLPGFQPFKFIYESSCFPAGMPQSARATAEPDLVRIAAFSANLPTDKPVAIDIEAWKVDAANVADTIRKLLLVAACVRANAPEGVQFGFYAMFPVRNYRATQTYYAPGGAGYTGQNADDVNFPNGSWWDQWLVQNALFQDVADAVDYIFPCLYTFYDDEAGWLLYAAANIDQAATYGKPVLAVIWPQFHDAAPAAIRYTYIPWVAAQIDALLADADVDGLVIWGGAGPGSTVFDDSQAWYTHSESLFTAPVALPPSPTPEPAPTPAEPVPGPQLFYDDLTIAEYDAMTVAQDDTLLIASGVYSSPNAAPPSGVLPAGVARARPSVGTRRQLQLIGRVFGSCDSAIGRTTVTPDDVPGAGNEYNPGVDWDFDAHPSVWVRIQDGTVYELPLVSVPADNGGNYGLYKNDGAAGGNGVQLTVPTVVSGNPNYVASWSTFDTPSEYLRAFIEGTPLGFYTLNTGPDLGTLEILDAAP